MDYSAALVDESLKGIENLIFELLKLKKGKELEKFAQGLLKMGRASGKAYEMLGYLPKSITASTIQDDGDDEDDDLV